MRKAISSSEDQDSRYADYMAFVHDKYYLVKVYNIIKGLNLGSIKSLDVGCADGSFSAKLKKELGYDAYGIDISKGAVALAKKSGVKAICASVDKRLPFKDKEFDLVVACELIEHIYDTDFLISELSRVLKKGGLLILTTPNLASAVNRVKLLLGLYPSFVPEYRIGGAGHIRAYTLPVLLGQLRDHHLTLLKAVSPNIVFPVANPFIPYGLKKIAIRLGDFFPKIGSHLIVVVRK